MDNAPDKNTEPLHPVESEPLQVTRQTGKSPDPVLQQPGEEPVIHEYVEVVEVSGKDRDTRGTTAYRQGNKERTFPQQKHNAHKGPGKNKKEAGTLSPHERQLEQQEVKAEIKLEAAKQWVVEPAQPAPLSQTAQTAQSVHSPHSSHPGPGLLHENREFSLSIGTIAVTVEEPQARAEIQPIPTVQIPTASHRDQKGGTGTPSSRLGRHYVRIRG